MEGIKIYIQEKLFWEGELYLKRPRDFTEFDYKTYFRTDIIPFERVHSDMLRHPLDIFGRLPVWVLKQAYQYYIKNAILTGEKNLSEADCPLWTLDISLKNKYGANITFEELDKTTQAQILQCLIAEGNHREKDVITGIHYINSNVVFYRPERGNTENEFCGIVDIEQYPGPNKQFEYEINIAKRLVTMYHIIAPEYSYGENKKEDVTKFFCEHNNELLMFIDEHCRKINE